MNYGYIEGLPIMPVERDLDNWNILVIKKCIFCGKTHTHGAGNNLDFGGGDGPRISHCTSDNQDYYVVELNNDTRKTIEKEMDRLGYSYKKADE